MNAQCDGHVARLIHASYRLGWGPERYAEHVILHQLGSICWLHLLAIIFAGLIQLNIYSALMAGDRGFPLLAGCHTERLKTSIAKQVKQEHSELTVSR